MLATGIQIPLEAGPSSLLICSPGLLFSGIPSSLLVKNLPAGAGDIYKFDTWLGKIPLEEEMAVHSILAGKSHGQRSLLGYSPRGHKESDPTEHAHMPLLYLDFPLSIYMQ